ncbi:MAG: hypothetical protein QHC79_22440 [Pseudosphingobacterium sp.]|nr:hypothetical protein [Pseudosphingobacterium sp.]
MRVLYILILSLLLPLTTLATKHRADEFEEVFTRYADSTLIFSGSVPFSAEPKNVFIVSKKGDTVSFFTYHYDRYHLPRYETLPDSLGDFIRDKQFPRNVSKFGPFFSVHEIPVKDGLKIWRQLMELNPWKMADDNSYGSGCPPIKKVTTDKKGNTVTKERLGQHDLHTYFFDLLTKNGTKHLRYYAPEVLEKACPGKDGRKQAIKVKELLLKAFGKKSVFWTISGHRTYREYPVVDYFK